MFGDYGCLITPDKECIFKDEINKLYDMITNDTFIEERYLNETFIIYQIYEIK